MLWTAQPGHSERPHGELRPHSVALVQLPANSKKQSGHLASETIQELNLASVKSAQLMPCEWGELSLLSPSIRIVSIKQNDCCLKSQTFEVFCYTAIDDKRSLKPGPWYPKPSYLRLIKKNRDPWSVVGFLDTFSRILSFYNWENRLLGEACLGLGQDWDLNRGIATCNSNLLEGFPIMYFFPVGGSTVLECWIQRRAFPHSEGKWTYYLLCDILTTYPFC